MNLSNEAQNLLNDIRTSMKKKAFANNWNDERVQSEVRMAIQSFLNSDEAKGLSKEDRINIHKANLTNVTQHEVNQEEIKVAEPIPEAERAVKNETQYSDLTIEEKYRDWMPLITLSSFKKIKRYLTLSIILRLVCSIMLVWSLSRHKYDFYVILRWLVTCTSAYCASIANKVKNQLWTIYFVAAAILFNPIAPIKLSRDTWISIDIGVAVLFLISLKYIKETEEVEV